MSYVTAVCLIVGSIAMVSLIFFVADELIERVGREVRKCIRKWHHPFDNDEY